VLPLYHLAAVSLFLVFQPAVSNTSNIVTLVYYVLASAYILFNISRQTFFIQTRCRRDAYSMNQLHQCTQEILGQCKAIG